MLDALASGLRECSSKPLVGGQLRMDAFLDSMLRSRISRRVIAEQHLNLQHNACVSFAQDDSSWLCMCVAGWVGDGGAANTHARSSYVKPGLTPSPLPFDPGTARGTSAAFTWTWI